MPLKNDWQNGDLFSPAAANDMANAVNAIASETVFVENYRDGVRTDNQILDVAFSALAAGGEIKFGPGVTYTLTSTLAPNLTAKPGVTINGQGATITGAITNLFTPTGTVFAFGSRPTLTAAVTSRTKTLTVSSTAALQPGDLVNIASNAEVYDANSGTGGETKSEVAEIRTIVSPTVVELEGRTWNTYSLTGYTVTLAHYRPMRNITIKDLTLQSPDRTTARSGLLAFYFVGLTLNNVRAKGFMTAGIYSYGGINVNYLNCHATECSKETFPESGVTPDGANGYGLWVQSTVGSKFIGCFGRRNRHTIDAHASFDMTFLNCTAENDRSSSFSTHGVSTTKIIGCTSRESGGGIVVRGTKNTIIGNHILGLTYGNDSGYQTYGAGIIVGLDTGNRGGLCGTDLIIENNFIDISGYTITAESTSGHGIWLNSPAINARISGNTIKGFTQSGIAVRPLLVNDGLEISNNLIDVSNQQGTGLSDGPVNRPAITLLPKLGVPDPDVVYSRNVNILDNLVTDGVPSHIVYMRGGGGSGNEGERIRITGNRSAESCSSYAVYLQEHFGADVEVHGNEVTSTGEVFHVPGDFSTPLIVAPPGSAPRFYPTENLASNPSLEDTTLWTDDAAYSTEQAYQGTNSVKFTATGANLAYYLTSNTTTGYSIPCEPTDVFLMEVWVYGHAENVQTVGGTISLVSRFARKGLSASFLSSSFTASTALNGVWTKQSAYLVAPAAAMSAQFYIQVNSNVTAGERYYFDQLTLTKVGSTARISTVQSLELGHASDTSLTRSSAGVLAVEGVVVPTVSSVSTLTGKTLTSPTLTTPVLGTPSSGTLTNCTGLPVSGITASTSAALGVGSVELGHATDTTITRTAAGVPAVEGNPLGVRVGVPASAAANGAVGQFSTDASWLYVCTAPSTWMRAAIATW